MRGFFLYFLCLSGISNAQSSAYSKIPLTGKTIQVFIPEGYDTISTARGDLNKDNREDIVLSLASNVEDSFEMDDEPVRILIVLLNQKTGYQLVGKSSSVIMCRHCGGVFGDPFAGIDVSKGVLTVFHYGGSAWKWVENRKFRFQNNKVYLIGSTSNYFWSIGECEGAGESGGKYRDVNFVTGGEEIIEKDENCKLLKHTIRKIRKKPLVQMEDFKYDYQ